MKKRRNKMAAMGITAALMGSIMTGCGGGGSQTAAAVAKNDIGFEYAAAEAAAPAGGSAVNGYSPQEAGYDNDAWPEEMSENQEMETAQPAAASETGSDASRPDTSTTRRKLIRNVDLSMETDDFDNLLPRINSRITELGGYVEQSSVTGQRTNYLNEPVPRNARLTARIPSDRLDSFLNSVEESANILHRTESTQDVTLKYSDIESRKKSLTIEQDRIWALLEKAENLDSIIMLEQRLSDIRYELESMESQLRLYDNQVDYSTVTLSIDEVTDFTPTAPETVGQRIGKRFSGNLRSVKDFLINAAILLAGTSPVWIPVALILCLLWMLGKRRLAKKASEKNRAAVSDSSASDASDASDS